MVFTFAKRRVETVSALKGKIGKQELEWVSVPHGPTGTGHVKINGCAPVEVKWRKDAHGIWIQLKEGVFGFDISGEVLDEGEVKYNVQKRGFSENWSQVAFVREGEEISQATSGGKKKGTKIKAQMPGKIVRVLVKSGDPVEKDQPLMIIEAMKMENQIRSPQVGKIEQVHVKEGQAVETGAELLRIDV